MRWTMTVVNRCDPLVSAVSTMVGTVVGLTFRFGFGNDVVLGLGARCGSRPW